MSMLREHWFDLGLGLAALVGAWLVFSHLSPVAWLLWLSLMTLFIHQFEEYRYPGYFPGMLNSVMFGSAQPDRYPLNTQSALIVNVVVGWLTYFLAAVLAEKAIWLGMAAILVSTGNVGVHTLLFNVKGKTLYNPGLVTAILLFLPIVVYFFALVIQSGLATPLDWGLGLGLGLVLNYVGVIKLVDWLKDENTPYIFPRRNLKPEARQG
jgi:Protein of unknown function with HXXEE motif